MNRTDTRGAAPRGVALPALGAVVVLAAAALAVLAAHGTGWVSSPPTATSAPAATPSASLTPPPPATQTAPPSAAQIPALHHSGLADDLLVASGALVVACALVLLARRLIERGWPRWGVSRAPRVRVGPAPADDGLPEAVDRALVAVDLPDARDAVVQAWLLLGQAAAAAGTPARASETAAEYAARLADAHRLPTTSLRRLAALYREARFSAHPVGPGQRAEARAELEALRSALAEQACR